MMLKSVFIKSFLKLQPKWPALSIAMQATFVSTQATYIKKYCSSCILTKAKVVYVDVSNGGHLSINAGIVGLCVIFHEH